MIATIILLLHLWGFIPAEDAINFLYLTGFLLIFAEIFVTSFGVIAFNGALAIFIAYALQSGNNAVFGVPVDWPFLFGVAFIEVALIIISILIYLHYRKKKVTTGIESMIGSTATVKEWAGSTGTVHIQGENWQAASPAPLDLAPGDKVRVKALDGLVLIVERL